NLIIMSEDLKRIVEELKQMNESLMHMFLMLEKRIDDVLWYHKVGDLARVIKVRIVGPPPSKVSKPNAPGARNPLVFWSYVFIPRNIDRNVKYPLIVLPHGGVHANMSSASANVVRELIAQGYIIIAPEYRGSTGYGKAFYELIDYGGLEIEDTHAARNWMVENCRYVDSKRIGIVGWSHGGLHALMNIFFYPDDYQVAYAGVPVSDLIMRMGYKGQHYRDLFIANYHIGVDVCDNVEEYRRRSPVNYVDKLKTPLLIHTTTNDEDVNYLEVLNLINALKAAGKNFEYKIFKEAPGGHVFGRIDTLLSREVRAEVYSFIAKYLNPPNPLTSADELNPFEI
ncbi:MAG: prolyl oligopeptidase family serine peptidase, partial [Candidatus Methanomethylicia archaeon]